MSSASTRLKSSCIASVRFWQTLSALNADAQTCHLLLYELSQLYAGGEVAEEQWGEPLQYADLAEWQFELLESAEMNVPLLPGHTLCLDVAWHNLTREARTNPNIPVSPENLAYIIYTSGSTGRPKGVMITHRGLANHAQWGSQYFQVSRGSGSIVHTSLSFDLTITSLFLPLVTGRSVVLVPVERGVEALVAEIRRAVHLSLLKITPAHLELLNQTLSVEEMYDVVHATEVTLRWLVSQEATLPCDLETYHYP